MDIRAIRRHVENRPFIQFTIVLDNGHEVRVKHPESIFLIQDWEIIVVDNGTVTSMGPEAVSAIVKAKRKSPKR